MNVLTLFALVRFATVPVQSDSALARMQAMIARPPAMCGAFDQQKTLVGLSRPVKSSGRFCVVADRGVLWNTTLPFPSTLKLSRSEIVESQGDHVTTRLSASQEPTVGIISELLFSVLAGDFNKLRNSFTIDATTETDGWKAKLVPRDAGMKRVIGSMELTGGEYVRQVTIHEASGDRTAITFANFASGLNAIKPEELRALGAPDRSSKKPR